MSTRSLLIIALTFLFNYLFWGETLALNLVIYTMLVTGMLLFRLKTGIRTGQWIIMGCLLVSAGGVLWHGSDLAVTVHLMSFLALVGMLHFPDFRNALSAMFAPVFNLIHIPRTLNSSAEDQDHHPQKGGKGKGIRKYIKLGILPVIFLFIFYLIFNAANPKFRELSSSFFNWLGEYWIMVFGEISLARIFFFLFGWLVAMGLLVFYGTNDLLELERELNLDLVRKRDAHTGKMMDLKYEAISATILMALVNALVLVVNIIDINWIWTGFTVPEDFDLKQFVHEGTYLLILSILLSMILMFYFFRGNINFYRRNQRLKQLAYLWIIQNVVLAISVFLRNFHYIEYHGLAYKRIGVIAFLVMTVVGLILLWMKIRQRKTAYYPFMINGWAFLLMMTGMSLVNWDLVIARYNLSFGHNGNVDAAFYLELSPSVYPVIQDNRELIRGQIRHHKKFEKQWQSITVEAFDQQFDEKLLKFREKHGRYTWLSWSYAYDRAGQY